MIELPIIRPPGKAARNEQSKALAATGNALAVAFLASAVLQPLAPGRFDLFLSGGGLISFLALQGALHSVLYRVED
jgi:hypothetical protein